MYKLQSNSMISVENIEQSIDFYQKHLCLHLISQHGDQEASLSDGYELYKLILINSKSQQSQIEILCTDINKAFAKHEKEGIIISYHSQEASYIIKDVDNNKIKLNSPLENLNFITTDQTNANENVLNFE